MKTLRETREEIQRECPDHQAWTRLALRRLVDNGDSEASEFFRRYDSALFGQRHYQKAGEMLTDLFSGVHPHYPALSQRVRLEIITRKLTQ